MKRIKRILIYLCIFLFIIISCKNNKQVIVFDGEKETVYINRIKRLNHVDDIIPENFVKDKHYIKLMSIHDDLLFKEINKIKIVNDKIFILDGRLKKLLVFGLDGISQSKIGKQGNGPNEYIDIADFDIDSEGNIYTIDGRLDRMFIYNSDYSLKEVLTLPFEVDILCITEDDNIMFGLSAWNKGENEGASIIIADKYLNTLEILAYYDKFVDNAFWVSHYSFVKTKKYIIYNKPINNNILLFSPKGELEKIIEFDFGKKNVPLKERKDIENNLAKFDNYNLLKWITIVDNDFLIGTFWENRETKSFFVDRNKNEMFVSNSTFDRDIGSVAGFDEGLLIKFFIPGSDRSEENNLPTDLKEHLKNGEFALCVYHLR